MKRRIIASLLLLFLCFATGATIAALYIKKTTSTLSQLVSLHQIENLRRHLIISIQTVQSNLYTVNTPMGKKLDLIAENVTSLDEVSKKCTNCHHSPDLAGQIEEMRTLISDYEKSLSYYITASTNSDLMSKLKLDAAELGNKLLFKTAEMSIRASGKLERMTNDMTMKINRVWMILYVTVAMTFLLGIIVAAKLTSSITRPIGKLVDATRRIARGELGYTITDDSKNEFGELAGHFNSMSATIKEGYAQLEEEIAQHKVTQAALMDSESFLNTIFDSIRDPFCIINRSYEIVRINDAYAKMTRKSPEELIGKICYKTLLDRSDICDGCIVLRSFLSGDSCAKEKMIEDEGMRTWVEIYTYPIDDGNGGISHVIEYTRDITERKRSEEALRSSEERYALAAKGANDGLWDWDLTTNRIYYSYRWESMVGYGEGELTPRPDEWFSRVHPDDRGELELKLNAHLKGQSSHFESEYRIRHKDSSYRWMLTRGLAVRKEDGRPYRMTGSQTDITTRKTAEEQLLHDAFHDALTGLSNRALFMDRLNHVMVSSHRDLEALHAVLFLDIDRFKVINDSMGHTVGDRLLEAIAGKVSACVRPGDTVARLGGDEFAVLLENIKSQSDAVEVSLRVQKELLSPFNIEGHEIFTSTSIGIAMSDKDYKNPEQILRNADIAMYQAKAKGNGCYEVFDTRMHANVVDRLQLEADLHRAIEHNEFTLYYQPIMNVKKSDLIGFEALIRWVHPERGLIYPADFIPLAEETGLIFPMAEWTLWEASRQLLKWQKLYPSDPPLKMSINISGKQFSRPDLISILSAIVAETGVRPEDLALEITESMIMANVDAAAEMMKKLRQMGVQIHIDDFGTGYSSLNYLHRFPVSVLKIDRSFISKLTANGDHGEIISSIVSLAQSMNIEVIAEGVELAHQLSNIIQMQCNYAQGFLFSRPMKSSDAAEWISNRKRVS